MAGDLLCGIHDSGSQNQLASNFSMVNVQGGQACGNRIIGSIEQNNMYKSNSDDQRNNGHKHETILDEDPLSPNVSSTNSKQNNCNGV